MSVRAGILVAGGTGERFGRPGGKQLAMAHGLPVAAHALRAMCAATMLDRVVLVCHPDQIDEYRRSVVSPGLSDRTTVVGGGSTRRLSVAAGLAALPDGVTVIAVHDGARPLIDPDVIDQAVLALEASPGIDGVVVGHPAYDTVKSVDGSLLVVGTPDRSMLWIAQTPQVLRAPALVAAHARAADESFDATDDAGLIEHFGGSIRMIQGPRWNLKVTVAEDLEVVEALLAHRRDGRAS